MNGVQLLCWGLLCLAAVHTVSARARQQRQATFSCPSDQTEAKTAWLFTDTKTCGDIIGEITNFYDEDYRKECQRWQGLPVVPARIAGSYVFDCAEYGNGTAKYRAQVCCEDTVTVQRCFTCSNQTFPFERCSHYGDVDTCPTGQVCQATFSYHRPILSSKRYYSYIRMSCMDQSTCTDLQTNNTRTCRHGQVSPSCTYCCDQPFCNYEKTRGFIAPKYVPKSPCDPNPCYRAGTCQLDSNSTTGYVCLCRQPYYGARCKGTPCVAGKTCANRGVCSLTSQPPSYYKCYCRVGWGGQNCTEAYSQCSNSSQHCLNGGICYDHETFGLRCKCPAGFVGARCELKRPYHCKHKHLHIANSYSRHAVYKKDCTQMLSYRSVYFAVPRQFRICHRMLGTTSTFGAVKELPVSTLSSCERGDEMTWYSTEVCCPACFSNPCQNGGWCVSVGEDYVCKCRHGYEGRNCESKVAICVASGDPHYETFDGQMLHFQGTCKYNLATPHNTSSGLPYFRVLTKNEHRNSNSRVSYIRYMEVELDGHVVRLDRNKDVYVDGVLETSDVTYPNFRVVNNGRFIRFETNFSLVVEFDGRWTALVKLPPQYGGQMSGLCGDYNGSPDNDFTLSNGTDVSSSPQKYSLLGNSWQVDDPQDNSCTGPVDDDPQPCSSDIHTMIQTNEYCGLIVDTAGPFAACIRGLAVSAKDYYASCAFDVCANQENENRTKEASCGSLEAFAAMCEQKGYPVNWRELANCPLDCPTGMSYTAKTSACPATCSNPDADTQCPLPDTESCVCPTGHVIKEGMCVDPQECGCYDSDGTHYNLGATWFTDRCVQYECANCTDCSLPVGQIVETSSGCDDDNLCVLYEKGGYGCQNQDTEPETCTYEFKPEDCARCKYTDSTAGYLANPCNSTQYVQCEMVDGVWQGQPHTCPPCTRWRQDILTCDFDDTVACVSDYEIIDETVHESDGDTCTKGDNTFSTSQSLAGGKTEFVWQTENGDVMMACPCGTVFSLDKCACILGAGNDCSVPSELLCLNFDKGWNGFGTSTGAWVDSGKVLIKDGGVKGKAAYFCGNAKLEIPYFANAYGSYGQFAVSFWFKRTGSGSGRQGLMTNGDCVSEPSFDLWSGTQDTFCGGIATQSDDVIHTFQSVKATKDDWHHVVMSYSGSAVTLYVDNQKRGTTLQVNGNLKNKQCPMVLGHGYPGDFFTGYMDEICFYREALSENQVAALYVAGGGTIGGK